jgi:hypothetical protein
LKWYSIAAVIFVCIMLAGGNSFFGTTEGLGIEWLGPWVTFSLVIGVNLVLLPVFYLLQGCNQVAQFWLYRLALQILNGIVLWASILMGAKLWSLSIAGFACIVWSILFLWQRYPHVIRLMFSEPTGPQINWSREVWPMQWRVALSWMSSSFTSQLFAPILFRTVGPSVAGRAGLTITLSNALVSLAGSWVNTRAPRFGILIAQRNFKDLDRLFRQAFVMSTAVASTGALTAWAGIWLLNLANSSLAERVLSPLPAAMLLLASVITTIVTSLAIYLRAHKKEPLVAVLLLTSLATAVSAVLVASGSGADGVFACYLALLVFFQLPSSILVFRRSRRTWHSS